MRGPPLLLEGEGEGFAAAIPAGAVVEEDALSAAEELEPEGSVTVAEGTGERVDWLLGRSWPLERSIFVPAPFEQHLKLSAPQQ